MQQAVDLPPVYSFFSYMDILGEEYIAGYTLETR